MRETAVLEQKPAVYDIKNLTYKETDIGEQQ